MTLAPETVGTKVPLVELGHLYVKRASIVPAKHLNEAFDLFSVPAYERGLPDHVVGSDIGSSKVAVEPGDTLLCRIVPHIRRAWVVPQRGNRRQIASGEWIVLRSDQVDPRYLRHMLLGDPFHIKFMSTVAGVGGSLMRARPTHAASISLPLPPLPEQRRIAAILDQADELRAKRRRALALLDELADAVFVDMFGEFAATRPLGSLCVKITDGTHQSPNWAETGVPFLFVSNIVGGTINYATDKYVSEETYAGLTRHTPIELGDVLYTAVGSYGVPVVVEDDRRFVFQRHIAHIKPRRDLLDSRFLRGALSSANLRRQADRVARGVAQKTVTLGEIGKLAIPDVPLAVQQEYADRIVRLDTVKQEAHSHLAHLDELFASLQHRAFSGQL